MVQLLDEVYTCWWHSAVVKWLPNNNNNNNNRSNKGKDPCLLRGFNVQNDRVPHAPALNVPPEPTNETFTVTYKGTGNMTQCLKNVEPLLLLNNHCTPIPCAMNNVVQPQIDFNSLEFYGLSEFFYTLETLKMIPPVKYSYHEALSKAQEICNTNWDAYHADLRKEKPDLSEEK
ncbi:unnamed protein product [Trichobilharzia regenti]|nr:unnamed protein product [Trichobilharzia regenti]